MSKRFDTLPPEGFVYTYSAVSSSGVGRNKSEGAKNCLKLKYSSTESPPQPNFYDISHSRKHTINGLINGDSMTKYTGTKYIGLNISDKRYLDRISETK